MPKLIDLTGKKFTRLTVIKKANIKLDNRPAWVCKCSCGNPNEIVVSGNHLRTGHTRSCGCLQKEIAGQKNFVDITNQRFGKLIALKRVESNKQGQAMWKCQCDCGNIVIIKGVDLRSGHSASCGCLISKGEEKISQILNENNINFIQQKTFETCHYLPQGRLSKFDFYVNNNYLIEFDGKQHYLGGWNNSLEDIQNRDFYKNNWCKENNIPLIRIPYSHLENLCLSDLLLETTKYRVV